MTEVEDTIIQAILDLLNANGLTAQQAKGLLGLNELIDVGEMIVTKLRLDHGGIVSDAEMHAG
jgi:hypothetical protein